MQILFFFNITWTHSFKSKFRDCNWFSIISNEKNNPCTTFAYLCLGWTGFSGSFGMQKITRPGPDLSTIQARLTRYLTGKYDNWSVHIKKITKCTPVRSKTDGCVIYRYLNYQNYQYITVIQTRELVKDILSILIVYCGIEYHSFNITHNARCRDNHTEWRSCCIYSSLVSGQFFIR